jgi:hypothetical protein
MPQPYNRRFKLVQSTADTRHSSFDFATQRKGGIPGGAERDHALTLCHVIASRLDTPRQIVSKWRQRFYRERLAGLDEQPRGGRPPRFSPQRRGRGQGAGL